MFTNKIMTLMREEVHSSMDARPWYDESKHEIADQIIKRVFDDGLSNLYDLNEEAIEALRELAPKGSLWTINGKKFAVETVIKGKLELDPECCKVAVFRNHAKSVELTAIEIQRGLKSGSMKKRS